jgi:hypothetical protein
MDFSLIKGNHFAISRALDRAALCAYVKAQRNTDQLLISGSYKAGRVMERVNKWRAG